MLSTLIGLLKALPENATITNGFDEAMSYRGYYCELGLNPSNETKVSEMIEVLQSALGKTFEGYKGGEYTMSEDVDCYLAPYGSCGMKIVGIDVFDSSHNKFSLVLAEDN